jgi:hypothetical protein
VHRTLDDVVCVAQPATGWCQEFSSLYKAVCGELDIPLAEDCLKLEKAFTNETRGIVLGVMFDASTLTWRLTDQKIATLKNSIHDMYMAGQADLKQTEGAKYNSGLPEVQNICAARPKAVHAVQLHGGQFDEAVNSDGGGLVSGGGRQRVRTTGRPLGLAEKPVDRLGSWHAHCKLSEK